MIFFCPICYNHMCMKSAKLLDELEQKLAERKVLREAVISLSNALTDVPFSLNDVISDDLQRNRVFEAIQVIHDLAD